MVLHGGQGETALSVKFPERSWGAPGVERTAERTRTEKRLLTQLPSWTRRVVPQHSLLWEVVGGLLAHIIGTAFLHAETK